MHVQETGWKYSCITGDEAYGDTIKLGYATKSFGGHADVASVIDLVKREAKALQSRGLTVIRRKVELVIFDHKEVSL